MSRAVRTWARPPPDMTSPTEGAAVPVQGRQPDQRGAVLAAHGASRWEIEYERPRTPGADTGHAAQEVLTRAPDRAGAQRRITIVVQDRQARIAPRDRGLDICVEAARRNPQKCAVTTYGDS